VSGVYLSSEGDSPLVISFPHVGTQLAPEIVPSLTPAALEVSDTDWHVDRLYDFAATMGASLVQAVYSRTVIDLNRPPDDESLYPGQVTTGLCPTATFAGEPLYSGAEPDEREIVRRRDHYWRPYHAELGRLLARARAHHGHATLLDAHSIASHVPRLFDGRLPDVNVGTFAGRSCAAGLSERIVAELESQSHFTHVLNGRFKGGYITRHYGQPEGGAHAVQFELGQLAYLDEPHSVYVESRAADLKALLRRLVGVLTDFRPARP
jgi:N-formylglutamate deformylase